MSECTIVRKNSFLTRNKDLHEDTEHNWAHQCNLVRFIERQDHIEISATETIMVHRAGIKMTAILLHDPTFESFSKRRFSDFRVQEEVRRVDFCHPYC